MTDPRPRPDVPPVGSTPPPPPALGEPPPDAPRRRPIAKRHYLWIAGAAVVVAMALHWLGPVLTPFLIGAIFAYLGTPLTRALEHRGVPRSVGTLLVILLFGIALLGLFFVLVPLIQAEVTAASKKLPQLIAGASARLGPWLEQNLQIHLAFDFATLREFIADNLDGARDVSLKVLSGVKSGGLLVVSVLVNLALIPVVMFYLLRDWNMILDRLFELVPRRWEAKTREIVTDIDGVLAEFLRGQISVMLVLALYYAIALSVAGLDHALPIGILTGLLVFIPYVGFGLGLVLGMIAALLQWTGWPAFLAVVAVYGVGQLLENYVLLPWLVGDRIGLHPLAVIFALLAFGQLFGFAGVLLALPVCAALLVGLREVRKAYYASPLYQDEP
jgi:predicted PurR-regulated permease PerM